MGRHWRKSLAAVAVIASLGTAVGVSAQDKDAIVKQRQDFMKRQGADLKYIGDFVKGAGGDQAGALAKINDLIALNPQIVTLFPPGTSSADLPGKTYAKPDIWADKQKFDAIPPVLLAAEQKLADALKSGDKAAIGPALGNAGKNGCGACHSNFREPLPQ